MLGFTAPSSFGWLSVCASLTLHASTCGLAPHPFISPFLSLRSISAFLLAQIGIIGPRKCLFRHAKWWVLQSSRRPCFQLMPLAFAQGRWDVVRALSACCLIANASGRSLHDIIILYAVCSSLPGCCFAELFHRVSHKSEGQNVLHAVDDVDAFCAIQQ